MAKLILTHEVTGLGSAGDVVDVKNGYARNYLVPQGFAIHWTRGGEKQVTDIKQARASRALASLDDAQALKAKLESATITVKAPAAPNSPRTLPVTLTIEPVPGDLDLSDADATLAGDARGEGAGWSVASAGRRRP